MNILDKLVRRIAKSYLLKYIDGYKTTIFSVVQAVNSILVALYMACPALPAFKGMEACAVVDVLNGQWLALSVILGQLGLQFGIIDAKAKVKQGK